jgi:hypothetical protein
LDPGSDYNVGVGGSGGTAVISN